VKVGARQFGKRASALLQEKVRSNAKFNVLTNTQVTEFRGNGKLKGVIAKDRATGETLQPEPFIRELTPAD